MILIAGGQLDVNIRVLAQRMEQREIPFHKLLVGPENPPDLRIDIKKNSFELNGVAISPTGCFIRHDVFLYKTDNLALAHSRALNWYQAVRGWVTGKQDITLFNRYFYLRENNKIHNLILAQDFGLPIPETVVVNDFTGIDEGMVQKPVAGGEYTGLVGDLPEDPGSYPRFIQPRLNRPEMRIYRIGPRMLAFWLHSAALDYRCTKDIEIEFTDVPQDIGEKFMSLCDRLELDFAAADFMTDDEGKLHFLEVNSQPMFAAFDRVAKGQLCDAIIDYLSE